MGYKPKKPTSSVMQQGPDGKWVKAEPLGWLEEHPKWVSFLYSIIGVSHCGKKGWRDHG